MTMANKIYSRNLLVLIASVLTLNVQIISAADGFLFTMPKVLRHGDLSEFCISVLGPQGGNKTISMSMIDKSNTKIQVLVHDVYTNGEQKCNNFTVPQAGTYEMVLYNDTDILHDSVSVTVEGHNLVTLVQSDKPMYKPGQTVKFRILTFKSDQKPRTGMIGSIYVKNPSETRVKQFMDVDSQGIASLEFQLTKEAQLGKWEILVFLNESNSNEPDSVGTFEVKEYVLPRFEVKIQHPSFILANDEVIDVEVCASYTYGKPVEGYLDLKMCWWTTFMALNNPCFHQVVWFSGCHNVSVNVSEMQGPDYQPFSGIDLKTTASVTEMGTGAVVNATLTGPQISTEPLKVTLEDYTNGFFKPRLPYYGKAIVTKPDGTPAPGEKVKIVANDYKNDLKFIGNYTTDEHGTFKYALCGAFTDKTVKFSIDAVAYEYNEDTGSNHRGMYTPRGYREIRQWFSPSLSYIDIPKTESNHKCGDSLTLSVPFTTRRNADVEFMYQVLARGKIIQSGSVSYQHNSTCPSCEDLAPPPSQICLHEAQLVTDVPVPPSDIPVPGDEATPPLPPKFLEKTNIMNSEQEAAIAPGMPGTMPEVKYNDVIEEPIVRSEKLSDTVSSFLLDIPISTIMAPKFTLLIYHTLPDGEVIADSMEYNVEPCFDNEVKMTFSHSSALPGESVNVQLEATPGSICGLGIVDKSVNILGGKHQVTAETIFKALEEYNAPTWVNSFYSDEAYCEDRIRKLLVEDSMENEEGFWHYNSPYVDAIQAFRSSGFLTLTDLNLQTRPCSRNYPVYYESIPMPLGSGIPGIMGPVPFTVNRQLRKSSDVKVRSHFPETWLWDLQIIGVNGSEDIQKTAPHTITSWVGNAVCMDAENGVGVSPLESITTFLPFFVHLKLPYSAVRGERLPLMINVYNYVEKCLHVQLTLEVADKVSVHNSMAIKKPKCVCGGKSVASKLWVTPEDIGSLPITVKAEVIPGICDNRVEMDTSYIGLTDAVKRNVFVEPEGVKSEYTHTSYLCPKGGKEDIENLLLPLPEAYVKDSASGEVKIIGDIMGPALTNLDNLVRMPTGCGEQNMVGFTPNIFVLKYLRNTGRLTEEIQKDCLKYMEIGYQRELKYRHDDGSYSAFGKRDMNGSVWLTAFVLKSYAQARPYIFIDDRDMDISLDFLRRSQLENGCFRETGKVFSSYMMGGLSKKRSPFTSLTSYVLIALLKAKVNSTDKVIKDGFNCIGKDFRKHKNRIDSYSLALLAYAHTLYNPYSRICRDIMRTLHLKSKSEGSLKYWSRNKAKPPTPSFAYYHSAPSAEVEMTSYALLSLLKFYGSGAIPHTNEVAMWMSQQRNPSGGFASTQDTVVGLNALSEFALLTYSEEPTNLSVTVEGKGYKEDFSVSEEENTVLLLQSLTIPTIPNTISIRAEGTGCALVQANVRFNKLSQELIPKKPGMYLRVQPRPYQHDIDRCDRRTLKITVGTRGHHRHSKGMSLLTVKMITSWAPVKDSLTKLLSLSTSLGIKRYEFEEEQGVLTIYFDELRKKPIEFFLDVEQDQDMRISSPKSSDIKIFQYYETDVSLAKSYNLKTTCGTKREIPRTMKENSVGPFDVQQIMQVRVGGPSRIPVPGPPAREMQPECPVCAESANEVTNLKDLFCNSTTVYKAIVGRGRKKYPAKLKVNIKASKKLRNINKFVKFTLPEGCDCSLFPPPVKRVHIFTSNTLDKKNMFIDASSAIIKSNKQMEKQLRKLKRTCN